MKETTADGTTTWRRRWTVGRVQLGYRLMRHTYAYSSDRWVFHPEFVYDRKAHQSREQPNLESVRASDESTVRPGHDT